MNRRVHVLPRPENEPVQDNYGPKYDVNGLTLPLVVRRPTRVIEARNDKEFAEFKPAFDAWKSIYNPESSQ